MCCIILLFKKMFQICVGICLDKVYIPVVRWQPESKALGLAILGLTTSRSRRIIESQGRLLIYQLWIWHSLDECKGRIRAKKP